MIDSVGQLYATEADPDGRLAPDTHEAEPSIRLLRGYLVRHALFRGPLVVGDSQINNNPHLRELLRPDPDREFPVARDLSVLLEEGHLVPVVREGRTSLAEIHASQRERDVQGLPPAAYVEYLDDNRHDFGRGYDVGLLARQFRRQMLFQFSPANARSPLPGPTAAQRRSHQSKSSHPAGRTVRVAAAWSIQMVTKGPRCLSLADSPRRKRLRVAFESADRPARSSARPTERLAIVSRPRPTLVRNALRSFNSIVPESNSGCEGTRFPTSFPLVSHGRSRA